MIAPPYLEYSDKAHAYYVDGKELPSVTTILDAAGLVSQFCKQEEARFRGTAVHELCAQDDLKLLDLRKVRPEYRNYVRAWRQYRIDAQFKPTLIEHRVDELRFGYSGRFDRLGVRLGIPGEVLIDIKTSQSGAIPKYARLQLAAYALALDPNKIYDRVAVSLMPSGKYNTAIYPQQDYLLDRGEWLTIFKKAKEATN